MPWGDILRDTRGKLGYSLEMIEEETKIRKYYLEALENDDFSSLPPKIYAIGFLKKYARLLQLNENEIVEEFKRLAYGNEIQEEHVRIHHEKVESEKKIPWKNIIFGVVFLIVVLWLSNYLAPFIADQGSKNYITGKKEVEPQVNEPAGSQGEKPGASAVKSGANLKIKLLEKCWLLVMVDGQTQFTGVLEAGQEKTFSGKQSVYLKAGNAGGLEITFNGEKQPPLGDHWEVKDKEFVAAKQGPEQE
ncbi:MAG: RodZ domain-containing protein [Syntrophomonas sp.]